MSRKPEVYTLTSPDKAIGSHRLKEPIIDGGEKIDVLHFRKPNQGDLCAIESGARGSQSQGDKIIIARLSGILPETADTISIDDMIDAKEALKGFLSEKTYQAIEQAKMNSVMTLGISSGVSSLATGDPG